MRKIRFKHREMDCGVTLERLEDRIVLDASVDASCSEDGGGDSSGDDVASGDAVTPENNAQDGAPGGSQEDGSALEAIFDEEINVVLISDEVAEIEALSNASDPDSQVIVYDSDRDDLGEINSLLTEITNNGRIPIGQLAILSHGAPGITGLSDSAPMLENSMTMGHQELIDLSALLAEDARVDLYGCSTGAGIGGENLVEYLSATTGAVVWASDDPTGNTEGSDWDLEIKSGPSNRDALLNPSYLNHLQIELAFMPGPGPSEPDTAQTAWSDTVYSFGEAYSGNEIKFTFTGDSLKDSKLDHLILEAFADLDGGNYVPDGNIYHEIQATEIIQVYGEDHRTELGAFGNLGRFNFFVWEELNVDEAKWDNWTKDASLDFYINFSPDVEPVDRAYGWVGASGTSTGVVGENLGYYGWPNFVRLGMDWSMDPVSEQRAPETSNNTSVWQNPIFTSPHESLGNQWAQFRGDNEFQSLKNAFSTQVDIHIKPRLINIQGMADEYPIRTSTRSPLYGDLAEYGPVFYATATEGLNDPASATTRNFMEGALSLTPFHTLGAWWAHGNIQEQIMGVDDPLGYNDNRVPGKERILIWNSEQIDLWKRLEMES